MCLDTICNNPVHITDLLIVKAACYFACSFTDSANITQPPVDVTVNQTFSSQFNCISFGNPIPQIVWSRVGDDDLSDNTDIITVTTMVDSDMYTITSSLVINSTERFRDQGVYNCTASNGVADNVGAVNVQSAELVAQGKHTISMCYKGMHHLLSCSSSTGVFN